MLGCLQLQKSHGFVSLSVGRRMFLLGDISCHTSTVEQTVHTLLILIEDHLFGLSGCCSDPQQFILAVRKLTVSIETLQVKLATRIPKPGLRVGAPKGGGFDQGFV